MTREERKQRIESYGNAYHLLTQALHTFPKEMWQWKPAPEKWSIHEIIIHITDSEANSYVRCRRLAAEPGSGVYGYNENKWAMQLSYHQQSTEDALELFKWLRKLSYNLLKTIPEQTWQTAFVQHSESGKVTFEEWLQTYEEHVPVHIRQMQRNLVAWKTQTHA
jgi:hypothetical protein